MTRAFDRRAYRTWLSGVVATLAVSLVLGTSAQAQSCPSGHEVCRATAPAGALLHHANSQGIRVWTTACGPNTMQPGLDSLCHQISRCPAAGGFGKFLQAVTFDCRMKHFDGYFGLDGMTFGILDWTANDLPPVLQAYHTRNRDKFDAIFGPLRLPMDKNGCLDWQWACDNNKQGKLMCDEPFHDAFATAIKTSDFQKAEVDFALSQYENRIKRFARLGLKTEYGNTAMAVLANNLRNVPACQSATWKQVCAGQPDETKMVDCMLDQYAKNSCRGNKRNSEERVKAIKAVFAGAAPSENIHPTAEAVISCSDSWGSVSR